jgi:hypothetical protein
MEFLNKTLIQKTFHKNGTRQVYTQLTFSLKETHFITSTDPAGTSSSDDNNDSKSSSTLWNDEVDKRNYIIYAVTAGVVIILGK